MYVCKHAHVFTCYTAHLQNMCLKHTYSYSIRVCTHTNTCMHAYTNTYIHTYIHTYIQAVEDEWREAGKEIKQAMENVSWSVCVRG
jgi:hypothetical protein